MIIKEITFRKNVTLTCYIQDISNEMKTNDIRKSILIFPGGGYHFCSDREAEPIALTYLKENYNAFVLRYSVKQENLWPKPLEDANMAMKYLHDNHKELNIDKEKIAVIGFSAGGHLAASLGTSGDIRPNAMLLIYPGIISAPRYGWNYPTPVADSNTPETFIATTYEDEVVPWTHSLHMVNELNDKNIPVEFHLFRKGLHGLSLANKTTSNNVPHLVEKDFAKWVDLSLGFLQNVLGE